MNLNQVNRVYFIGIGGIGMSALARYFNHLGIPVAGYDKTETALTRQLTAEGIDIHYTDNTGLIAGQYTEREGTLVVITPAVPDTHAELTFFRARNFEIQKRAQVLGLISQTKDVLAIAGTHGKTSTSTMVSHLLKSSGTGCSAFLGGISINYGTNLLLSDESQWVVVEADEYDRSFLQLHPKAAIVTSMDADHLDIYGTHEAYVDSFHQFIRQIRAGGFLILKKGLNKGNPSRDIQIYTYDLHGPADFFAENIFIEDGCYHFDLVLPSGRIDNITSGFPGLLYVENAIAAMAMAWLTGVNENGIRNALKSFAGVKRRFEYHIKTGNMVYIDDYGHHPEELRYTIESVKQLYPGKKITGIFQPHLYSRTSDLADDFARSLELLDEVILLEIYPAREKPIPGVTSEMLLEKIHKAEKQVVEKKNLEAFLQQHAMPEILLTMGAGDIDQWVGPIKKMYMSKLNNQ